MRLATLLLLGAILGTAFAVIAPGTVAIAIIDPADFVLQVFSPSVQDNKCCEEDGPSPRLIVYDQNE